MLSCVAALVASAMMDLAGRLPCHWQFGSLVLMNVDLHIELSAILLSIYIHCFGSEKPWLRVF